VSSPLSTDLIRKADAYLDGEAHDTFAALGSTFYQVFGADPEGRINTQIRNLQQVVVSATRFGDIEDFVKNQMGKNTRAARDWRRMGDRALDLLKALRQQAEALSGDEGQRLQLRLHLARGWVRAVVGAYLFDKAHEEMTREKP
jgi:hypothetical protein